MVDDTALMQKTLDFLVENAKITVSTEENNAALNTEAAEDEAEKASHKNTDKGIDICRFYTTESVKMES